ncbi:MAG: PaaI family thioesterase [Actinomycetota bacterium]|nr:PaaI family thioesterase [Actinomycetota bacterium]
MALEGGLDALLGLEVLAVGEEEVVARVPVRDAIRQPFGLVHGGLYAAVAESLASRGTYAGVAQKGAVPLGIANHTSFLRPIAEGTVHAVARRRHGGRTTWLWDVELSDDQGRLCALGRVTVAVRPRGGSGS